MCIETEHVPRTLLPDLLLDFIQGLLVAPLRTSFYKIVIYLEKCWRATPPVNLTMRHSTLAISD